MRIWFTNSWDIFETLKRLGLNVKYRPLKKKDFPTDTGILTIDEDQVFFDNFKKKHSDTTTPDK